MPVAERPGCRKGDGNDEGTPKTPLGLNPLCDKGPTPNGDARSDASGCMLTTTMGEATFSGLMWGTGGASGCVPNRALAFGADTTRRKKRLVADCFWLELFDPFDGDEEDPGR